MKNEPLSNPFKIFLLITASCLVAAMLLFSQHVTDDLLAKQREVVRLYARSLEYIATTESGTNDFTFVFNEVIRTIDFPIILTDPDNEPIYWKNLLVDTASIAAFSEDERNQFFRDLLEEMDSQYTPLTIALNDTLVLNYVHYGESGLIRQLRWLPYIEIGMATIFILIAYLGFAQIKRSEQSNIWVGMAKETAHQLGTPLSSLMGWMDILRSEAGGSEETLDEMENDVQRLNKVTARFSKIGSMPDLKTENLTDVVSDVIRYMSKRLPQTGAGVTLAIGTQGEFPARINRELFEWVIENLTKNALDAIEGPAGSVTFSFKRETGVLLIDVTDTGKGI
ncbi:MAG: HAMP domain-containing histidine kinase, partial [Ignavibacteria bacterium]|nr:HAMP domain-containing histidine kinase [Ignavibacteria bacterium]